jgi:hypothetical protein
VSYAKLTLSFEANQGQTDKQVKFLARGRGYGLFLTGDEAVLELQESGVGTKRSRAMSGLQGTTDHGRRTTENARRTTNSVLRLKLVNANQNAGVTGANELPGKVNYFIGNDPKKWRTNVPTYAQVRYRNVYPGIDLVYHGNQGGQLEYDFVVAPGADPNSILLALDAARRPGSRQKAVGSGQFRIDSNGDLVVPMNGGDEVRFRKPVVYQEEESGVRSQKSEAKNESRKAKFENRRLVEGQFLLEAQNRVHFALGPYDHTQPVVIDPVLVYSTYLGGSGNDVGYGIAVDSSGNAYVTGGTTSTDFPVVNPYQPNNKSTRGTAFVAKLDAAGSALVYSTYLGGSGGDYGKAIAVDSSGSAYVAGSTCSSDFPTVYPLEASLKGACDGFVAKLNPAGSALVYSTYLGGSGTTESGDTWNDAAAGIAVDSSGSAYVTGTTYSTDFPVVNPYQPNNKSTGATAFVAKANPDGSALVYSTYLGGSGGDYGNAIAVDSLGNAYVAGSTGSSDFPTVNPLQASLKGENDGFVAKLNPAGSALVYSTYLGGTEGNGANGVASDSSGNTYVTGWTGSTDFPTFNPLQATNMCPWAGNAFVAKLNATGSAFVYSTYLGGGVGGECDPLDTGMGDSGTSIAADSSGNAYVAGQAKSPNFPVVNAFQPTDKSADGTAFVASLNAAGTALAYSSYLGGSVWDVGLGIAVDSSGNAYVTGQTSSSDFPVVNPFQGKNNSQGGSNAFVTKISPPAAVTLSPSSLNFGSALAGTTSPEQSVTLTPNTSGSLSLTGITTSADFALVTTATSCPYGGGTVASGASCTIDVTFTPTAASPRTGTITITYTGQGSPQTVALSGTGIAPAANVSPASLSFSSQDVGTASPPQPVTFTNTGSVALSISSVAISSGWTQSNNCVPSVAANARCTINVSFQPTVFGPQTGTLTLTDYASNSPQTVGLSGTALAPVVDLSATILSFPGQAVSTTSAPQTLTLTNTGNGALTPVTITVSGDFAQTNTCGSSVPANGSCTISVTFTPTAVGTRNGALTIVDNASNSPQTVSLSGTGTAPGVGLSPSSLAFSAQMVGTASTVQGVALTNSGNAAVIISGISASGDFSETNTCGASVSAGANCTINVTFKPTAGGPRTGALTVTDNSNGVAGSTQTVSLSGTGKDYTLTTPSGSSSSATVSPGQTATYTLSVGSEGGMNQAVTFTCAGAPSDSTCTVSPNPATPGGNVTVTVATTAPSAIAPRTLPQPRLPRPQALVILAMLLAGVAWTLRVSRQARASRRTVLLPFAAGLLLALALAGCGGGGSSSSPPANRGTPPGAYALTVTGTVGSGSTAVSHSVKLTLTVS